MRGVAAQGPYMPYRLQALWQKARDVSGGASRGSLFVVALELTYGFLWLNRARNVAIRAVFVNDCVSLVRILRMYSGETPILFVASTQEKEAKRMCFDRLPTEQ